MFRFPCLAALLLALAAPLATPSAAQVPVADLDAASGGGPGFRWPHRPGRPGHPGRPQHPGWGWGSGHGGPGYWGPGYGGPGYGGLGGLGLSIDLGSRGPGADGSVREPVMTIERDSPARTRQIRNSPGAPLAGAAQPSSTRLSQPPMIERAPASAAAGLPGQAQQGVGELNGGGSALGQVLSSNGETFVLLLTLPESRVTCLGQLDGPPALFPSMGSALACTDGAQGNALFATPEEGSGSSASFTLDGGRGGYLVFP